MERPKGLTRILAESSQRLSENLHGSANHLKCPAVGLVLTEERLSLAGNRVDAPSAHKLRQLFISREGRLTRYVHEALAGKPIRPSKTAVKDQQLDHHMEADAYEEGDFHVTFPEFVNYLTLSGMKLSCSECGSEEGWNLDTITEVGDGKDLLSIYRMSFATGQRFKPYFAMNCINCGAIRHLSAKVVAAKVRAAKAATNGE